MKAMDKMMKQIPFFYVALLIIPPENSQNKLANPTRIQNQTLTKSDIIKDCFK